MRDPIAINPAVAFAVLACACATILAPGRVGGADVDPALAPILSRARAALGPEMAIESIKSIHFTGTIELDEGRTGDIDWVVRKPMQQRQSLVTSERLDVTGLDDFDAWNQVQLIRDPRQSKLTILGPRQAHRLRANTFESLYYFSSPSDIGGKVELLGDAEVDGTPCDRVAFTHFGGMVFVRHFDKTTGRLLLTETETGGTLREKGDLIVRGVRFPREIETSFNGETRIVRITAIEVNEEFEDEYFRAPIVAPKVGFRVPTPVWTQPTPVPVPTPPSAPVGPASGEVPAEVAPVPPAPTPPAETTPPPPPAPAPEPPPTSPSTSTPATAPTDAPGS
jgi:hypothetical protein